jgi:hypothetical protein
VPTKSRVAWSNGIIKERFEANSRVNKAFRIVEKSGGADGRVFGAGCVGVQRTQTGGRVAEAGCVAEERKSAVGRVAGAECIAKKRTTTSGRVIDACCVVNERIVTEKRVASADDASLLTSRSRLRRKRKARERQCDENWRNCCVFGLSQWIHNSSSLFPRSVEFWIAGPEETKNQRGKVLRLIRIRLATLSLQKSTPVGQDNWYHPTPE